MVLLEWINFVIGLFVTVNSDNCGGVMVGGCCKAGPFCDLWEEDEVRDVGITIASPFGW